MRTELLYFEDCPHWRIAAERLDAVLAERGLTAERVIVDSPDAAARLGFRGSPTIRVDGDDLLTTGDEPVGMACRVYDTPDGLAGSPTVEQLAAAIDERRGETR